MEAQTLKAPFPYFGGKSKIASVVWARFGQLNNYIEPFCGSAAMLLLRPDKAKSEIINDGNCYVANFWRAVKNDPNAVVYHADNPVNEVDLSARHKWLMLSRESEEFRERMRSDPEYYDVKIAGWWCWGASCWIGGGWCSDGNVPNQTHRPNVSLEMGINCHSDKALPAYRWMTLLSHRLRFVKVACGDWHRVCCSRSVTTLKGFCGVFLDPPYPLRDKKGDSSRSSGLYVQDSDSDYLDRLRDDVLAYCMERTGDPLMRIAVCGYDTDGYAALENIGWECVAWKANGGYANIHENPNAYRERVWFSPACKSAQPTLF